MTKKIDIHRLENGMVILGEPLEEVGSVAFGFMVPCGAARIPKDKSYEHCRQALRCYDAAARRK